MKVLSTTSGLPSLGIWKNLSTKPAFLVRIESQTPHGARWGRKSRPEDGSQSGGLTDQDEDTDQEGGGGPGRGGHDEGRGAAGLDGFPSVA